MPILDNANANVLINGTHKMTPGQAQFIRTLVIERVADTDEANLEYWRQRWTEVQNPADVDKLIADLKAVPTLAQKERQRQREQRPTEAGYYRNPETGELFRITQSKKSWDIIVAKYSETGGPRRLLTDMSQIVKGKWKRLNSFQSRLTLNKIQKDWKVDPAELAKEYAYGFCPLHHGPLQDAVSVILGYGPDCAAKNGLPWSEEAAQAVLAANKAALGGE